MTTITPAARIEAGVRDTVQAAAAALVRAAPVSAVDRQAAADLAPVFDKDSECALGKDACSDHAEALQIPWDLESVWLCSGFALC